VGGKNTIFPEITAINRFLSGRFVIWTNKKLNYPNWIIVAWVTFNTGLPGILVLDNFWTKSYFHALLLEV
jgi:hypothetical protein